MAGNITNGATAEYVLEASAGQTMIVAIGSLNDNATFSILSPGGETLQSSAQESMLTLPASGDYRVTVSSGDSGASYTVNFTIF